MARQPLPRALRETGTIARSGKGTARFGRGEAADGAGIFTGARGQGSDTDYPLRNTATPQGTLRLSR